MNESVFPDQPDHTQNRSASQAPVERALQEETVDIPDFSASVLEQFTADQNSPLPCQYDFEFISTYFDREYWSQITSHTLLATSIHNFEKHLPQCTDCHLQLGFLLETTDAYRNHLYRLETRLESFDLVPVVMGQMQSAVLEAYTDETLPLPLVGCGLETYETFSQLIDQALEPDALTRVEAHLPHCEPCRETVAEVAQLSGMVQQVYRQQIDEMPVDLAQAVMSRLKSSTVWLKPRRWMAVAGGTIAASVMFFLISGHSLVPELIPGGPSVARDNHQPVDVAALQQAIRADEHDAVRRSVTNEQDATYNVIYRSPEAYLFSRSSDVLGEEDLSLKTDVSAVVFH